MEQLQCNIVVMKHSQAKVLRLNLVGSNSRKPEAKNEESSKEEETKAGSLSPPHHVTPSSSPETLTVTEGGTSFSDSDLGTSPFSIPTRKNTPKKLGRFEIKQDQYLDAVGSESGYLNEKLNFQPWIQHALGSDRHSFENPDSTTKIVPLNLRRLEEEAAFGSPSCKNGMSFNCNLREVISLSRKAPPGPPPLCSICQHKSPSFGMPPRLFSYAELELATGSFSRANFLAEGGYGSVHRGVLPNGQAVAVKQYKLASSQGDKEFCSEVEVLSCAQHRNVVMLIGFCIEGGRRLLVYEYICNGALDSHLYGNIPHIPAFRVISLLGFDHYFFVF